MHASCESPWHSLAKRTRLGGLLPPQVAFQEHAAHPPRWPGELSSKGSSDTCISDSVSTFLYRAFTAHGAHLVLVHPRLALAPFEARFNAGARLDDPRQFPKRRLLERHLAPIRRREVIMIAMPGVLIGGIPRGAGLQGTVVRERTPGNHQPLQHQKGEKVIAIIDNNGYVLAPLPVAPVNEADTVLLPEGLKALKQVAKRTGLELEGAYLNLDGGFDAKSNRKAIFNAGMMPNIKENSRNRKTPKRGRKRLFNAAIHTLRERVERTFAWEDKFKRLLLRFESIQQRHYGMKLMAYTLINLRRFCSA